MVTLTGNHQFDLQISESIDVIKKILGEDICGIYLYGSSIVGGLQKYSDIDLFVISNRSTTTVEKSKIVKEMLTISNVDPTKQGKPIEMTIVVSSAVKPWKYPPSFDFQYGDWLRKEFESGNVEPWNTKEKPDLAIVITQILLANKSLFGPDPKQLLDVIPYDDFMFATLKEVDTLMGDLDWDTRNVLLTFARIWSTVETDEIRSKPEAASWVICKLPSRFQPILQRALNVCLGKEAEHWEDLTKIVNPCAEFMMAKIKEKATTISMADNSNKLIKLAKT